MVVIEYLVHLLAYSTLMLLCIGFAVSVLSMLTRLTGDGPIGFVVESVGLLLLCAAAVAGSWIAHDASRRRVFEGEGFGEAVSSALAEARLYASFLPGVGKLLKRRASKRNRFDPPDDAPFA